MGDRLGSYSRVRTSEDKVCRKDMCWSVKIVCVLVKLPDVSGLGLREVGRYTLFPLRNHWPIFIEMLIPELFGLLLLLLLAPQALQPPPGEADLRVVVLCNVPPPRGRAHLHLTAF